MTGIRFGALVLPSVPWATWLDRVRGAEAAGFDMVVIDDHLANPQRPDHLWLDAWVALAAAAQATETVRLGTLVANVVLRHPAVLARQALSLDHVSGGRLELGLGSGYAPVDHRASQTGSWDPAERAERFSESVAMVAALLSGDPPTAGRYYDVGALTLAPESVQRPRPPITVAADGRRSLEVAARHADRWVSFGGFGLTTDQAVAVTRRRITVLDDCCDAVGRSPSEVGRSLLAGSAGVNADPIWTSVSAFETFVGRFVELGIDTFVLYWPPASASRGVDDAVVDEVVHEVIPRLAARS